MKGYSSSLSFSVASVVLCLSILSCIQGPSEDVCISDTRMDGEKPTMKMITSHSMIVAASREELIEDVTLIPYWVEFFDRNGRSMASSSYNHTEEVLCEYDECGNIMEFGVIIRENRDTRLAFEYDDLSNLTKLTNFRFRGWVSIPSYDDKGNLTQILHTIENMGYRGKTVFGYDTQGNMNEEIRIDKNDTILTKRTYQYQDNGNMVEQRQYTYCGTGADGFELNGFTNYDNLGNEIEHTHYVCFCGCCDPSANDLETHISTYDYVSFDEYGNWTKCYENTQIIDISGETLDEHARAKYRSITYYQ